MHNSHLQQRTWQLLFLCANELACCRQFLYWCFLMLSQRSYGSAATLPCLPLALPCIPL
jgi:hypothetical protein